MHDHESSNFPSKTANKSTPKIDRLFELPPPTNLISTNNNITRLDTVVTVLQL